MTQLQSVFSPASAQGRVQEQGKSIEMLHYTLSQEAGADALYKGDKT